MSIPETEPTPSTDPKQIEKEIARHRAEVGATVDELSERMDVKKQAKRQWKQTRLRAAEGADIVAENAKRALKSARKLTAKQWAMALGPVLAVVGGIIIIVVTCRREP